MPPPKPFVELCEAQQEGKISNVIGTVIDALPSILTKKGDHMLTFTIDDGSLQRGQKCRLFARRAQDLPQINGLGDVIILKRARYAFVNGAGLLTSTFGQPCPWVVFHAPVPKDISSTAMPKNIRFQVSEISTEEIQYVVSLGRTQDRTKYTPLNPEVKAKLTKLNNHSVCCIKDLMLDSYPRIVGEVVKIFFNYERASLYITDYTENQFLYNYGSKTEKSDDAFGQSRWPGPPGKYTLLVECWPPHSQWLRENASTGSFIELDNVHIKSNKEHGRTEGALHANRHNEDQLRVRKLEARDVSELLYRKEMLGWANGFDKQESESDDERTKGDRDGRSEKNTSSKNRRKRKKEQQAKQDSKRAKSEPTIEVIPQQNKLLPVSCLAVDTLNENIRCENGSYSKRTIDQIRSMSRLPESHTTGDQARLDELISYATVRVVEFKPSKLEDFARARDMTKEEQQQAEETNATSSETEESDATSQRSANSLYKDSTQVRRQVWEWKFVLLLEDASARTEKKADGSGNDQLIVHISNADAEYLLGMKALDLRRNKQTLNRLRETLFILWGDLEERKGQKAARALGEISTNTSSIGSSSSSQNTAVTSRPFKCIIEEFGEEAQSKMKRKFRIRGTTIMLESQPAEQQKANVVELDAWSDIEDNDIDSKAQNVVMNERNAGGQVSHRAPRAG